MTSVPFALAVSQCFSGLPSLQRKLQIPLLWHPCEARVATQQTSRRHAVHGPQTAAGPAETEVGIIIILFIYLFIYFLFEGVLVVLKVVLMSKLSKCKL